MFKIITKEGCVFCTMAKELLRNNNKTYTEVSFANEEYAQKRQKQIDDTGQITFPWIYHDGIFIGGYKELTAYLKFDQGLFDQKF